MANQISFNHASITGLNSAISNINKNFYSPIALSTRSIRISIIIIANVSDQYIYAEDYY